MTTEKPEALEGTPALSPRTERAKERIDRAIDAAAPTVAIAYVETSDIPGREHYSTTTGSAELKARLSDGRTLDLAQDVNDELVIASFDSAARELIGLTEHQARTLIGRAETETISSM